MGGHQGKYREIASTHIYSLGIYWTSRGSAKVEGIVNTVRYSRFFLSNCRRMGKVCTISILLFHVDRIYLSKMAKKY